MNLRTAGFLALAIAAAATSFARTTLQPVVSLRQVEFLLVQ